MLNGFYESKPHPNLDPGPRQLIEKQKEKKHLKELSRIPHRTTSSQTYNLAGGALCAGQNCTQSLWLFLGPAEFDNRTDLHFCSQSSPNARVQFVTKDLHSSSLNIIQPSLQERFHLSHLDIHPTMTLAGTLLLKQIHETSNINIGKFLTETSEIIT